MFPLADLGLENESSSGIQKMESANTPLHGTLKSAVLQQTTQGIIQC